MAIAQNFPAIKPNLLLDFAHTKALDPRITFTRASTATFYDGVTTALAEQNLLVYSEEFDNAAWTKSNCTITANTEAAPDGTTTAETINEGVANAAHRIQSTAISFVSGATYVFSFFAKNNNANFVQLVLPSGAFGGLFANFDISTGVVGTFNTATASIESVGNDWYRCIATATATGSAVQDFSIGLADSSSLGRLTAYTGTSRTAYLWGAQLEQTRMGAELVFNGDNEAALFSTTPATTTVRGTLARSTDLGIATAKFTGDGTTGPHYIVPIGNSGMLANRSYSFSVRVYIPTAWVGAGIRLIDINDGSWSSGLVTTRDAWETITITRSAKATDWTLGIGINASETHAGESFYIDNLSISVVGATAYNPTTTQPISNYIPVLRTAQANQARFQHDPTTGESLGLLIEEQRTNLLTYSEQFDNAAWNKINSTITANTIIAPNGTLTADKLVETSGAAAQHATNRTSGISIVANTQHTFSCYAKAGERSRVMLFISNAAYSNSIFVTFNLSNGTSTAISYVGTASAGNATITPVGDNWYLCTVSGLIDTTSTSANTTIYLDNGTSNFYAGDGTSGIYIWGAQLEAGAFPTSYIPTVSSTVTRSADNASMTGTNFSQWYNQNEGTLFCESQTFTKTGNAFAVQISDNSYNNRVVLGQNDSISVGQVIVGGSLTLEPTSSPARSSAKIKQSFGFATNSAQLTRSGVQATQDSSGAMTSGLIRLDLGSDQGGFNRINGIIAGVSYYPLRLTNAQLQALTS